MKKTLVLLHGALGSEADVFPIKELLQNTFHVYTFNFTGHDGGA
mgnify:FL=1